MSSCCQSKPPKSINTPKKLYCPDSDQVCMPVSAKTISHHLKDSWTWIAKKQGYYFCSDPNCDTVYFGEDLNKINKARLRLNVGIKTNNENDLICYCYGVSQANMSKKPAIRDFIINKTKNSECACDMRNPSGRCCLKDFKKA